jgi:ribose/xylose/arabinose/galactoside ABC-type transport system permease subunit
VYVFVVALLVLGRVLDPTFWTGTELLRVVGDVAILGIVAVGVGFITLSGHYVDLSIPGIMGISGIVSVLLLPYGFAAAIVAGMATGATLGLINGAVVGVLRLNPIIWTLASMSLMDGATRWACGGMWRYVPEDLPVGATFDAIYRGQILGVVPVSVALFAVAAVLAHFLLNRTVYGRQVMLTGASYDAARMTGVNVGRVVMLAFVFSGLMAALAGIVKTSLTKYGDIEIGLTYDFQAITAVVLGGTALAGGRGGIAGILGGVLVIGLLGRILPLIHGVGQDEQLAIRGVLFIVVVALGARALRKAGRSEG